MCQGGVITAKLKVNQHLARLGNLTAACLSIERKLNICTIEWILYNRKSEWSEVVRIADVSLTEKELSPLLRVAPGCSAACSSSRTAAHLAKRFSLHTAVGLVTFGGAGKQTGPKGSTEESEIRGRRLLNTVKP